MTLSNRLIKYADLKPCTNAFIDTRSPGSDKKENFTLIGPGVAENPDQHIHISIPHGFNIGGARQPAGCLNSKHSHLTEEFFVVHQGTWAFTSGANADDGRVILTEGDIISIPMDIFRGFENVGEDIGYLHAVLGGDDPGRVLWAPAVFDLAKEYGLVLLEDGSLVDTTLGENIPEGKNAMPVTSDEQIAEHRVVNSKELESIVQRTDTFEWSKNNCLAQFEGVEEVALVGAESVAEDLPASKLNWSHKFVVRGLKLSEKAKVNDHIRYEEEVIFVHQGEVNIHVDGEKVILGKGDTFTTPIGSTRSFTQKGKEDCILYITRRHDQPQAPKFI
ncbi:cupin domain-containing protein [Colwellia hornerae]|uniref:Cupin domain-containing protein n=1 Tax=Colwellia hornerae TaxID=89402 RepID=A0A5C6QK05_9GAMM|nr:cupin domain-containing protein [Colwellia hornerae]TWX53349.1 cupin domain-containing protein [Colwellia hornerae]TWX60169.1 cupin domain-containing protein [Colwellia hornerae]TWX69037.1 cupin domain-containing protein [Colwellia hornerae]